MFCVSTLFFLCIFFPTNKFLGAKKHWLLDPPTEGERDVEGFMNVRGGPRQSSLNAALDRKHKVAKKKPGLLKGIGHMFRFGKHRKMEFGNPEMQHYQQTDAGLDNYPPQQQENEVAQVDANHNQNERVQEQPREPLYQRHGYVHRHAEQVQVSEKIMQITNYY